MKIVVGLGNPGTKYAGTRHNMGFAVIDVLAERWNIDLTREKFHAWHGDGRIRDQKVVLLKPTTFMNRSGDAVLAAGRFYRLEKEDLLVVYDDWALPLGSIRMRENGSAGSHNGMQHVIERVGFSDFARLRVGIGDPLGNPTHFVLTRFSEQERLDAEGTVSLSADAAECWIEHGAVTAMNRFNKRGRNGHDAEDRATEEN